jgi:predicted ATP-grasp superfamily ATP-dependent carboligase
MRNVIVTDLKYRMALSPVRTLFRAGYSVTGIEFDSTPPKKAIGFYSSCLSDKRFLPDDEGEFVESLKSLCIEKTVNGEKPAIVPVGRKVLTVLQNHPELSEVAHFIVPSKSSIDLADDKWLLYKKAQELGIPAPKTTALSQHCSIDELAGSVITPAL